MKSNVDAWWHYDVAMEIHNTHCSVCFCFSQTQFHWSKFHSICGRYQVPTNQDQYVLCKEYKKMCYFKFEYDWNRSKKPYLIFMQCENSKRTGLTAFVDGNVFPLYCIHSTIAAASLMR